MSLNAGLWKALREFGLSTSTYMEVLDDLGAAQLLMKLTGVLKREPTPEELVDFTAMVSGASDHAGKRRRIIVSALDRPSLQEPQLLAAEGQGITQRDILLSTACARLKKMPKEYPVGSVKAALAADERRDLVITKVGRL